MKKVPFFDYPRLFLDDQKEILETIEDVGSRGAFILQSDLTEFESSIAELLKVEFAIGVANATDGLEMAWKAVGLESGDEVIVSAHTMIATASAVVANGGKPVPVDIGPDGLIDVNAIENAISSRTKGISPTQLNGRTCDMETIMSIAKKYNLYVVEDAAQALGSKFKGKSAGTFGEIASFSLFPAKLLGCLGDGGIVVTNNEKLYKHLYQQHDHGRGTDGNVGMWGRNSRLDNLQAAILLKKMGRFSLAIEKRRLLASIYDTNLNDLEEITLPPNPNQSENNFDVFQNYEIQANNRDELREYLAANGIGTIIQWGGKAIHHFDALNLNFTLPNVDLFFRRCLLLPMNTFLLESDVEYVCEKIREFYKNAS